MTIPVYLLADGEAFWLLHPSLVSLPSDSTVQSENTYYCILNPLDLMNKILKIILCPLYIIYSSF